MSDLPRLYTDLAKWWPLLSAPEDYAEEAEIFREVLERAAQFPVSTVLELGSGGGNNASHLKAHFKMTLVDRSPGMLKVSRRLNPECEHHLGDMRTLRLGTKFDAVFVHDAVVYLTTLEELRSAVRTSSGLAIPSPAARPTSPILPICSMRNPPGLRCSTTATCAACSPGMNGCGPSAKPASRPDTRRPS